MKDRLMKIKFCSQRGFSIIQGMILAGAVAGLALVGTKLTTDQKLIQKAVESKSRVEQLNDMLYSVLQDRAHCAQTLVLNGAHTPLTPGATRDITAIGTAGTGTLAAAPFKKKGGAYASDAVYMNNTVSINNMKLTFPATFDQNAELRVTYGKLDDKDLATRTGKGTGTNEITKTIFLKIQRNLTTNAFESCYAVTKLENENLVQRFCEDMAATAGPGIFAWNPTYQTCTLRDLKCPVGQIYAGFDSNGNKRCNPLQNWANLNDLIDNSASPNDCAGKEIRFEIVGQRVRIRCDGGAPPPCTPVNSNWGPITYGACDGSNNRTVSRNCVGTPNACGVNNCNGCTGPGCPNTVSWQEECACDVSMCVPVAACPAAQPGWVNTGSTTDTTMALTVGGSSPPAVTDVPLWSHFNYASMPSGSNIMGNMRNASCCAQGIRWCYYTKL